MAKKKLKKKEEPLKTERLSLYFFHSLVFSLVLVSAEFLPSQNKLQILKNISTLESSKLVNPLCFCSGIYLSSIFYSRPAVLLDLSSCCCGEKSSLLICEES